jgi:hypothetical protein
LSAEILAFIGGAAALVQCIWVLTGAPWTNLAEDFGIKYPDISLGLVFEPLRLAFKPAKWAFRPVLVFEPRKIGI